VVVDAGLGDNHAAGVNGDMLKHADEPLDEGRRGSASLGQEMKGKRQLSLQLVRRQAAREPIDVVTRHAEGLQPLAKRGAALKCLVRGGHGHALRSESTGDPLQKLFAPMRRHVEIDVGEVLPPGVQEALEIQAVRHRVEGGDVEKVGDERSYRRATPHHGDARVSGMAGDLAHDQEVVGEGAVADHPELAAQPCLVLVARAASSALAPEPLATDPGEVGIGGLARPTGDRRERGPDLGEVEATRLGYPARFLQGLGDILIDRVKL
jgi:hypothetical protein